MKTILVENSTWNNIGDGFYQSGLYVFLKELFPNYKVRMGDGPIKRAFRPTKSFERNAFKLMDHEVADIHVFSGPMLPALIEEYGDKIKEIITSGRNYALVSCSLAGEKRLVDKIVNFFKEYPPLAFSSRDPDTYHQFEKYLESSYNGICGAFLVNKLPLSDIECSPFFLSSFYSMPEPIFSSEQEVIKSIESVELKFRKTVIPHKFDRHFDFLRQHDSELKNLKIVRPVHAVTDRFSHINFGSPNSFLSYNPLAYLSLYKAAEFTISDRIHSCAVSIALGRPARLFTNSPRAGIFDRLGIDYRSNEGFIAPCPEVIEKEEKLMAEYLSSRF